MTATASINCRDCGTTLKENDITCPKCGSRKKTYSVTVPLNIPTIDCSLRLSSRRKGSGELQEQIINNRKPSLDPNLPKGVREDRIVDRQKGSYDQVVTDIATGKVIHEEHTTLKKHNEQKKKQ